MTFHKDAGVAEIAWAAGLFEGEGTISIRRHRIRPELNLSVVSTDRDVIERFHHIVDVGSSCPIKRTKNMPDHWKQAYKWSVANLFHCVDVLEAFLPFLCERRGERARQAIDAINERWWTCYCGKHFFTTGRWIYCSRKCSDAMAKLQTERIVREQRDAARVKREQGIAA